MTKSEITNTLNNITKGTKISFGPETHQVYNITEGMYHAIKVLSNGDLAAINPKNLKAFSTKEVTLGLELGVMTVDNGLSFP